MTDPQDRPPMPPDLGDPLPVYSVVGGRYTYLLTGRQTAGACFVLEAHVLPGQGAPPHAHSREDEGFYVVDGEFEFVVDGQPIRLGPGDFLLGRRDIPHQFTNVGPTPGKLIITATPAGLDDFFAEIGTPLPSRESAPILPTDADIARLVEAAPRYGLTLSPPH